MPMIDSIRDRYDNGETMAEIADSLGINRKTVSKYIHKEDFSPHAPVKIKMPTILDPFQETLDQWIVEDSAKKKKMKRTAKQMCILLREDYGYTGSYPTVQKYVKQRTVELELEGKLKKREGYVPLIWLPGTAQADFGEADFIVSGAKRTLHFLVLSFPYSNVGYVQVFGGETAECICQGMKDIFEFIGGVPEEIVFDNATGAAKRIKGNVVETELFSRFRHHYGFRARWCNPAAGNEKGNVERKVGAIRNRLFCPEVSFEDITEYNRSLLTEVDKVNDQEHYLKHVPQTELFEEDRKALSQLPPGAFNVCTYVRARTNKYGRVTLSGRHQYSTRPHMQEVTVIVGLMAHTVRIQAENGDLLAEHSRQFGQEPTATDDPAFLLNVVKKKPGSWKQCTIRQKVPAGFRSYLDQAASAALREALFLLDDLTCRYGFECACEAADMLVSSGRFDRDNAYVLAARIASGGLPEETPCTLLEDYDSLLLGKERSAQ